MLETGISFSQKKKKKQVLVVGRSTTDLQQQNNIGWMMPMKAYVLVP
jgi:hypothetical protein